MQISKKKIIELDSIDSTNNYAMKLIDGNKAEHGLTIVAKQQTGGKGQRGKTWIDEPGKSLLLSTIVAPRRPVNSQFVFNCSIALSIATFLVKLNENWKINIKWPNDIIINDKKAGGILIENVLRGSSWLYSIVGLGLNINHESFPPELPYATSMKIASGKDHEIEPLRDLLIENILAAVKDYVPEMTIIEEFNALLYKRGLMQVFYNDTNRWAATILQVKTDGTIDVKLENGEITSYRHGEVIWEYGV